MEETKKEVKQEGQQKMSYDQLVNVANQLSEQNRKLYQKLRETNMQNALARLNFLFRVLEQSTHFSVEFVDKCALEIQQMIALPNPEENKTEETETETTEETAAEETVTEETTTEETKEEVTE